MPVSRLACAMCALLIVVSSAVVASASGVQVSTPVEAVASLIGVQALPSPGSTEAVTDNLDYDSAYTLTTAIMERAAQTGSYAIDWLSLGPTDVPAAAAPPTGILESATASGALLSWVKAVNDKHVTKEMSWEKATTDCELPSLRITAAFWANPASPSVPATVVTSGSTDRLQQLRAQCLSWAGPLSAILFQGLLQEEHVDDLSEGNRAIMRLAVVQAAHLAAEMQQTPGACQLSMTIVYEMYTEAAATALYPVNSLRNLARLQARTPVVAMLDVDLLPSKTLYSRFADPEKAAEIVKVVQSSKTVYIMPTFDLQPIYETASWAEALTSAPTKDIMVYGMEHDMVTQFHGARWPPGHNLTNYPRWKSAMEDYGVVYQNKCEPWVLGSRTLLPWHDARYRGFGLNKIQHINNLAHEGYQFMVLHDVYTIHRPHEHAEAEKMFMTKPSKAKKIKGKVVQQEETQQYLTFDGRAPTMTLREHVRALYSMQTATIDSGTPFQAIVGPQVLYARTQLAWWSGKSHVRRRVHSTGSRLRVIRQ